VWGGNKIGQMFNKPAPQDRPIGESWEIADRPEAQSVVRNGPLAGQGLGVLMSRHGPALLGNAYSQDRRFPLLVKILDARETLSLQVHPPASAATALRGEPKTEMWYIVAANSGAELYAGLKKGVTRMEFESQLSGGSVADCFHRIPVRAGDAMFIPSGRVHGIGAGIVLFEIQQNSDTTYRVFDWNRVGLDGCPRPLHIAESLSSIDFHDFEPELVPRPVQGPHGTGRVPLVSCPHFAVELVSLDAGQILTLPCPSALITGVVSGRLLMGEGDQAVVLSPGQFGLAPACLDQIRFRAETGVSVLLAWVGVE
jgi:mannose-6-phosphate isomerase